MKIKSWVKTVLLVLAVVSVLSSGKQASMLWAANCGGLPTAAQLKTTLPNAAIGAGGSAALGPGTRVGGLFGGERMWAAVVNRNGQVCATVTSTADPTQVWPGSQAIAKAKTYATKRLQP